MFIFFNLKWEYCIHILVSYLLYCIVLFNVLTIVSFLIVEYFSMFCTTLKLFESCSVSGGSVEELSFLYLFNYSFLPLSFALSPFHSLFYVAFILIVFCLIFTV